MIYVENGVFYIQMSESSYWFEADERAYLRHLHFGSRLPVQNPQPLRVKRTIPLGGSISADAEDAGNWLDASCLEYGAFGRGDYRESPLEIAMSDGSFNCDFRYGGYAVYDHSGRRRACSEDEGKRHGATAKELPLTAPVAAEDGYPRLRGGGTEALLIRLEERQKKLVLDLIYRVYEEENVILRQTRLTNLGAEACRLKKLMSFSFDMPNRGYEVLSLHGLWGREAQLCRRRLSPGRFVLDTQVGSSSNQANPAWMLSEGKADEGRCYGFNLIYSSNHYSSASLHPLGHCRLMGGIHPDRFSRILRPGEHFSTPEALLTFSCGGENGLSQNFHRFINRHILGGRSGSELRPITYNHWESSFFDYNEKKLLRLAKKAKKLGCEVFMLDDGWFGERDDDRHSLGDYQVNRRKFPAGLRPFFEKLLAMGLECGIWVEPEMVNPESDLYRTHPEYVLREPGREACLGRNQLVLDLCNAELRNELCGKLEALFDSLPMIRWVKWDMNRYLADAWSSQLADQSEVYHGYVMGLYEILERVLRPRPQIHVEMCSSGGNRFDLGMLCYASQIWASDNTDPVERLKIQEGLSYFYPLSCISNHVSGSPHQSTLRQTPLSTRFNVAAFGVLGYELDLHLLSPVEKKEIREQIVFYKQNRRLFQFGSFSRIPQEKENKRCWQLLAPKEGDGGDADDAPAPSLEKGSEDAADRPAPARDDCGKTDEAAPAAAMVALFQTAVSAVESPDRLRCRGLEAERFYTLTTKAQRLMLNRFGELLKFALPVKLHPQGIALQKLSRRFALEDGCEEYHCSGAMLDEGVPLEMQFMGSGYHPKLRMLGDFGSSLYRVVEDEAENRGGVEKP